MRVHLKSPHEVWCLCWVKQLIDLIGSYAVNQLVEFAACCQGSGTTAQPTSEVDFVPPSFPPDNQSGPPGATTLLSETMTAVWSSKVDNVWNERCWKISGGPVIETIAKMGK